MIERRRAPGGIVRDIDHGGGPFGDEDVRLVRFAKGARDAIPGAVPVAWSIEKPMSRLLLTSERNRRYREAHHA